MGVHKYVGWNRNERNITTGASQQFAALVFTADDDCTIVGVMVDIALSSEGPSDFGNSNIAGYARLVVHKSGNTIPLIQPNQAWNVTSPPAADTLNDADADDTWAILPFAVNAFTSSSVGALSGGGNGHIQLKLAPMTKRSLRRGDSLEVELNYSNGGNQNTATQESVTGTLFVAD